MGRDITGIRNDMKPNGVPSDRVHVAPTIATDEVEPEQRLRSVDHNLKEAREEVQKNQEFLTIKTTNNESGGVSNGIRAKIEALKPKLSVKASPSLKPSPSVKPSPDADASESIKVSTPKAQPSQEESGASESVKISTPKAHSSQEVSGTAESVKISTPRAHSSQEVSGASERIKISTPKAHSSQEDASAPENMKISTPKAYSTQEVSTEKIASGTSNASEVEIDNSINSPISKKNDLHRPVPAETPQPQAPPRSGKSLQYDAEDKHYDEEDNSSFTSSGGTSTRSASKFKPTVPVGPKFVCGERVERRKEYYKKLEEKQKALEAERLAEQARIKEEEEAALKKLRKSLAYRANPVPSFYREGPPPKAKLKKLPLTRPKSPKLTRGRSMDAAKSARDEKNSCGATTTPPNKTGSKKVKATTNTHPSETEQIDSNKTVVEGKNTSPTAE